MTAANHALTGTLIGLAVGNPWLALPLAFVSHFVCDAIPHYDVPGKTAEDRLNSRLFLQVQIIGGAVLCALIVLALGIAHPAHWLLAALCAFVATTPDLAFVPRYLKTRKTGTDHYEHVWFWKFHNDIQWFQRPIGAVVEVAWAAGMVLIISTFVR